MILCPALELRDQPVGAAQAPELSAQLARLVGLGFSRVYIIDRDAQHAGRDFNIELVKTLMHDAGVPAWVGGGIRDAQTVAAIIAAGAEHVVVGPSLWRQEGLLAQITRNHPGKIVALVDAHTGIVVDDTPNAPRHRVLDQALWFENQGVAGIIYMEHEPEGVFGGLDAEVIADLAFALTVPLYVTGGINSLADLRALKAEAYTGIAGVILGRALLDGRIDPITALALLGTTQKELS